jgi:hypothetical protein
MATKTKSVRKKKIDNSNAGTFMLVNGQIIEKGYKTEKTKRGFPTQLPIIKLQAGKKKIEVYQGLNETQYRVGQSVELKCSIMKVKSGKNISTKYILV